MNCFKQTVVCVTCGACQDSLVLYAFAAAALRHFSLDQMRINTAGLFQTSFETTQKPQSFVPITLPLRLSFVSVVFVLSISLTIFAPGYPRSLTVFVNHSFVIINDVIAHPSFLSIRLMLSTLSEVFFNSVSHIIASPLSPIELSFQSFTVKSLKHDLIRNKILTTEIQISECCV